MYYYYHYNKNLFDPLLVKHISIVRIITQDMSNFRINRTIEYIKEKII